MRKNYGLPYQGSKNQIAEEIIDFLPSGNRLVDLFGGGGGISHCASLSGKWNIIYYNELLPIVADAFKMAINGEFDNEDRWISREEFHRLKDIDPYVAICYSFNYNMKVYAYSPEMEVFKKALYYKMVFNDDSYMTDEILHWIQTDERDMRKPQNLRALNRIKEIGKDNLSNITVHCGDYSDYSYRKGDVVYCDIPYEGTDCRKYKGFDNKEFYNWVASRPYQVFFSSYEISDDRFFTVWKKEKTLFCSNTAQSGKRGETTEYIYSNQPYKKENKFIFGV